MSTDRTTPVLVGVGQIHQRLADPREGVEPLEMMIAALERAGDDARAPGLLRQAESIQVPRGAWSYGDPARVIGERLGAAPVETVGTPYGGNFSQACVIDAAREIQAGRRQVVLVAGAENGRSVPQAARRGVKLSESEAPGVPDRKIAEDKAIFHEAELARGMHTATGIFAAIESAIRAARGESLETHRARIARLWAGFNAVACASPDAWIRTPYTADEIGQASPDNPMVSFPYTRRMSANARVDMGAGLIVCSVAAARAAGVPDEKRIFLHAAAEANDSNFLSTRMDFHRSPALQTAGPRLVELAGTSIDEIEHLDLYSCFPSSVEVTAAELGIPEDRALTVTGGLTFGGGPLNSYGLHAVARMVEVLRQAPGSKGLVHCNGGWLAKHALVVYAAEPPGKGFAYEDLRPQSEGLALREACVDWRGPVTLEAYTVEHQKGAPRIAHAACLTPDGRRTWANLDDPDVMQAMMREEFCGRKGEIDGQGGLRVR